jgi:hypothetical protein
MVALMAGHSPGCRVGFGEDVDGLMTEVDQVVTGAGGVGEADEGVAGLQRSDGRAAPRCAMCDGRG